MRHLRKDYDAIQPFPDKRPHIVKNEAGETVDASLLEHLGIRMYPIIPEDEPVFLLRAKDPAAAIVVRMWANVVEEQGGDAALCHRVRVWAEEMEDYRLENYPDKRVADTPAELLR